MDCFVARKNESERETSEVLPLEPLAGPGSADQEESNSETSVLLLVFPR